MIKYSCIAAAAIISLSACARSDASAQNDAGAQNDTDAEANYQEASNHNPSAQYAQADTATRPPGEPQSMQPANAAALPEGAVRVQPAKIIDQSGFGQPMVAATMMIPVGWRTQGGIVWAQNASGCGPATPHINWTASAPDGSGVIQMLPEEKWTGHNMQYPGMEQSPCPNVMAGDPRQYFTQYVQRIRPGAQILDYRERADIVEGVTRMMPQQAPIYGMETRQWIGAGDMLLGYSMQGRDMREFVGLVAIFNHTRMPDGMGGVMENSLIVSLPSFTYRAPEGQLDFDKAAMIRNSYRADPQWSAKMAQHFASIARTNAKGAADRSEITSRTNSEISDMQMESWRRQQDSNDKGVREFGEYIRGVETYNDPVNGGTVQLDSTYDNAWQLKDGTYVLTDDPGFNPYAATGQDGQLLEPTQ